MTAARAVVATVLAAALAACGGKLPETRYYHLAAPAEGKAGGTAVLVVEPLSTDTAYDDERIVYRTNAYRFDYYDYHRWSAAPGIMIANYLEQALEKSGRFRSVVREQNADAQTVLGGRVAAIEEVDVSAQRWVGRIVIELRLTDIKSGTVLWSEQFEENEPLADQTPEGLARAISTAMARVVKRAGPAIADAVDQQAAAAAAAGTVAVPQ